MYNGTDSKWLVGSLISIFVIFWLIAIFCNIRVLSGRINSLKHIPGLVKGTTGSFYLGGLYNLNWVTWIHVSKKIRAKRTHKDVVSKLPQNIDEIISELAFEQMKLAFIRDVKMKGHRVAWFTTMLWLYSGAALFIIYKITV